MYAIYDTIFTEILYFAQLQSFDLVALDTDLQEHRDSRINHVRMHMGWIAQVADSFMKWWESAPTNQPFPHTLLTHEQRQLIHEDFVKATDFLGTTYRAYEQYAYEQHGSKQQVGSYEQLRHGTRKGQELFQTH